MIVTATAGPPIVIVPVTSGATSLSVSVALPVELVLGLTRIVYVPVAPSVFVSMNRPLVPMKVGATRLVPSGLMIDTSLLEMLTAVMLRLIL